MRRFDYLHAALVAATVFGWAYAAAWGWYRGFCLQSAVSGLVALVCTVHCMLGEREAV